MTRRLAVVVDLASRRPTTAELDPVDDATILPLPIGEPRTRRLRRPARVPVTYLPRVELNGHTADCPTTTIPAEHCGPCRSVRIGRTP